MSYRISNIIFFIFLIGIVVLWQQGMRLYPYSVGGGDTSGVIPQAEGEIQLSSARKLKILQLNFSIFEDPLYRNLRLRETSVKDISSIPHGRSEPFAETEKAKPAGGAVSPP